MQQTFNADMNISNLHQNVDPSTTLPVICGVEITTDRAGRYNLNALHRASGLGAHKAPAQWLRTLSAKQLIEELEKETMQNCIVSFEGRGGGTFAHELLAVEYAGWISPAFRLKVNQTLSTIEPEDYNLLFRRVSLKLSVWLPTWQSKSNGWSKKCLWMHLKSNSPNALLPPAEF